jgi:chromatin remodeling complex protein RSC6
MAPSKKSAPASAAPASVAAPAPVAAATPAPVEAKKSKPAAAVASTPKAAAPAKVVEAVVAEPVADEVATSSSLEDLVSKFAALGALLKETQAALKVLSKEYERMKKTVTKSERKRANARTNPNGFAKPALITDALCEFLAVSKGTEMSRTDVTRKINAYIKEHNLNKPENKRIILPDEKLRKILGVKPSEEVSFFSLQRYLSPLFVKKAAVAV